MNNQKAGLKMSLLMGLMMSFSLSLIGLLSAGRFTLSGFFTNFLISFLISFLLGMILPVRKIAMKTSAPFPPGSLKARAVEALISDLLYTPLMTFVMVYISYRQAVSHGAQIPFGPMLLKSELISIFFAFFLIFFLSPVLMK
ncbi:MAG: hypothetical protein IIZ33_03240, partial [Erysipelotrichaceae bacterium]|nr:hypothetical protein [Erysipelotrichaceae bacterium]